jgi:hypothetical protein
MKRVAIPVLALFAVVGARAQSFSVYGIDATNFPRMKANFIALDVNGQPYPNISRADFRVLDNGVVVDPTVSVGCTTLTGQPEFSAVLVLDRSNSMRDSVGGGETRWDWVKHAAKTFVNSVNFVGRTAVAVVAFDADAELIVPFTNRAIDLIVGIDTLQPRGGTRYDPPFLKTGVGALPLLATRPPDLRRFVIFLTDGQPNVPPQTDTIIARAQAVGAIVYAITVSMPMNPDLERIARATGGKSFAAYTKAELEGIYRQIALEAQSRQVCELYWTAPYGCTELSRYRTLQVTFLRTNAAVTTGYTAPDNSVARMQAPSLVYFGNPDPGTTVVQDITVRPLVTPLRVDSVSVRPGQYYRVLQVTPQPPAVVPVGQDLTVRVEFRQGPARAYRQATLLVHGEPCGPQIPLVGGPGRVFLIAPRGGEVISQCDTVLILWAGVEPTQGVDLAYSTDEGRTWRTIATGARGLSYRWVPPAPGRYRVRVSAASQRFWAWAIPVGGKQDDRVTSVAVTPDGAYLYVVGSFEDTLRWGNSVLVSRGFKDAFVAKLDAEGNLVWLFRIGGALTDEATGVAVDNNGHAYVSGYFESPQCYIGDTQFLSLGNSLDTTNAFLISFDGTAQTPTVRWVVRIGGIPVNSGRAFGDRVAVRNDSVFIEGRFRRLIEFGVGPNGNQIRLTSPSPNFYSTFTGWYRTGGAALGAMIGQFTPRPTYSSTTVQDAYGNRYEGGEFSGSLASGTIIIRSAGGRDGYVRKEAFVPASSDASDTSFTVAAPELSLPAIRAYVGATPVGTSVDSSLGPVLCNRGNYPVRILRAYFTGNNPADFELVQVLDGRTLQPGECASVEVRFAPKAVGNRDAVLEVQGDCGPIPQMTVWGVGYPPCEVRTADVNFPRVGVGQFQVRTACVLENRGTRSLSGTVRLVGPDAGDFQVTPLGGFTVGAGECFTVQVRFAPGAPGVRQAALEFDLGAECQPQRVQLLGEGAVAELRISSVDWGKRRLRTDNPAELLLWNPDTVSGEVVQLRLQGADAAHFRLTPPQLPLVLEPGDTVRLPVSFVPQQEGERRAVVEVVLRGAPTPLQGELRGIGVLPKIALQGYRFAPTPVGQRSAEVGSLRIRNVDTLAELFIAQVRYISGETEFPPDQPAFTAAQGARLQPGAELAIPVFFQPQASGQRRAFVEVLSDAAPGPNPNPVVADTVLLEGDGLAVGVDRPLVDFGGVLTCSVAEDSLVLFNGAGTTPLRITGYSVIAGDATGFELLPTPPFDVSPGGQVRLTVRFAPTQVRRYTVRLRLENDQQLPIELELRGEGRELRIEFGQGVVVERALPGIEVIVPLRVVQEEWAGALQGPEDSELCLRVRYPVQFLEFLGVVRVQTSSRWDWSWQELAPGVLEFRAVGLEGWTPLVAQLDLRVRPYLALPPEQELVLELCSALPRCLRPEIRNPRVRLADICFLNGRLVRLVGQSTVGAAFPNPVEQGLTVTIPYWTPQPAELEVELFNSMGQSIRRIHYGSVPAGTGELWLPTEGLGAGPYAYRVRIGTAVEVGTFVVLP